MIPCHMNIVPKSLSVFYLYVMFEDTLAQSSMVP